MEESEYNDMSSLWFNNQLFSSNGAPLKFYLEGYGLTEFHEAVRIIEAYGGELSSPDAPDTFVFCQSDHPVDVEKYDRYNIQYFEDSIIALYPQDIMKYKLRKAQNQESLNLEDNVSQHKQIHQEQTNNSGGHYCIDLCSSDPEDLSELQDNVNSCTRAESRVPMDCLEESQNEECPSVEEEVRPPCSETEEGNPDKPPKLIKYTLHEITDQPSTKSKEHNDESTNSHHVHQKNSEDNDDISLSSSNADKVIKLQDKGNSCTTAEARVQDDRLDESQIAGPSTNPQINDEINDNNDGDSEVSCQSSSEDGGDSHDSIASQTTDDSGSSQSESDHGYVPSGPPVSTKMMQKKKGKRARSYNLYAFTEDDNQTIIRWLIEKNVNPSNCASKIWKRLLEEKVLPHCDVTCWNLQGHFNRNLRKHPIFVQWINDMKTSGRRFTDLIRKTPVGTAFTEDENRMIIKWLMEKNILPLRTAVSIWERFLKEKVLPKRDDLSAGILAGYFDRKLKKHPTFVKWIEDMKTSGRELKTGCEKNPPYSEEENRIMIQYIIDHDAYKRAAGPRIWAKLLKSNKSSMDPRRTVPGLITHCRKVILRNYAKYTDNPEALKKFKEIVMRSQHRTRDSEEGIDLD